MRSPRIPPCQKMLYLHHCPPEVFQGRNICRNLSKKPSKTKPAVITTKHLLSHRLPAFYHGHWYCLITEKGPKLFPEISVVSISKLCDLERA